MAKKSQRRSIRYEKDKSGCMWGFISMFDFRHGHSTRKLIADRRRSSKHAVGGVPSKNKYEMLSNLDEVSDDNFDTGESKRATVKTGAIKHSVKKLIEEEMFIDQTAQVEPKGSRLRCEVPLQTDYKRKKKSSSKSCDMDIDMNLGATLNSNYLQNQHSRRQSKDNLDLDNIIEELCHFKDSCSVKHGNDGGVHTQPNQKHAISENIAREVIHEFVNQMILNGKDLAEARKFLHSHELIEALQLISSDKELFLALLQNPNSLLLKCIQEFANSQGRDNKEYSSVTCSSFTEQDPGNVEQTRETVNHKKHNFFRKKTKSQPKNQTNENGKTETSNRIVILKPGSMGLQNSEAGNNIASFLQSHHDTAKHSGPSARGNSHFSLTDLKNKLKHAMGREKHANPEGTSKRYPAESQRPSNKAILKDNVGMRSPNKDHFFLEKIARPTKPKDPELIVEQEIGSYRKKRAPNLYTEAKKHLSEMISSGDENMDMSSRQISKTLGRILSLPEYHFSPLGSPASDWEHHFVTGQTRFSTSDRTWEAYQNMSPKQATFVNNLYQEAENPEKQSSICDRSSNNIAQEIKFESNIPDELSHVDKVEGYCAVNDEIVVKGDVESEREINILESSSELVCLSIGDEEQSYDILEITDSERSSQCFTQDGISENQQSTPPSSSYSSFKKKSEELESGAEVCGRPSPVSVLNAPFIEDEISPGYQPIQVAVRPLHIQFEEQDYSPVNGIHKGKYCLEENELIYKYIKAVLQASELTTDQLLMKCHSSDKILDPSLFDREELPANQLCHDQKLLYDCINEVLMEVCWHYFAVSPFVNLSIRSSPNMKMVVLKVWEAMCWHFLPLPPPRTLDKIVRKDMEKASMWMDLRFDAEAVGFEMGEMILAELMEDTILSCTGNV